MTHGQPVKLFFCSSCSVTEQLTSWVPMIFSIYLLISTDVTSFPFYGGTCSHVITLAFCVYVGRAVFLMLQDMYLSRHLSKWWLSSLYHCVSVFCYGTMIFSGQNTLLGCAGLITKGQSAFLDLLWIFKLCEMPTHDRRYATMAILASLTSIFFRFVLPIWFVLSACLKQSPLAMHPVPLAALCLSFVFFGAMNAWFIYRSVKKVMKSLKAKQVAKLESIVKSKVPEVLHIPMSERNILSPTRALSDSTALRNSSLGFSFHNNFPFSNSKAEKTPFNVILMRQDEERDSGYFQTQLDMTLNRSSSTSSSHSDTHMHRTRHASDFEDIFLSSVEGDPIT